MAASEEVLAGDRFGTDVSGFKAKTEFVNQYPVREDVVHVARTLEPGVYSKQIAADFGISESCLTSWLSKAES